MTLFVEPSRTKVFVSNAKSSELIFELLIANKSPTSRICVSDAITLSSLLFAGLMIDAVITIDSKTEGLGVSIFCSVFVAIQSAPDKVLLLKNVP